MQTPGRSRALIYVRGTSEEIDEQIADVTSVCQYRGYEVVGIVREQPGATERWHEANRMLRHDQADLILVASAINIPDVLESATGALPGLRPQQNAGAHRAKRPRRTRPVPRPDAGA